MPKEKVKNSRQPKARKFKGREYRRKQRSTSIYFLLLTIFATFSLAIVMIFGITQRIYLRKVYEEESIKEVAMKGEDISEEIDAFAVGDGKDFNLFFRFLSQKYDLKVFLLDSAGNVLLPQGIDSSDPEYGKEYDFSAEMKKMLSRMAKENTESTVFKFDEQYIYGERIDKYGQTDVYLYVGKSMHVALAAVSSMNVRFAITCVFVLVLSFIGAGVVSGWLTKPLSEMRKKAQLLAEGDFSVDFHGTDYGEEMVALADSLNFARDELSKTDRMQRELIANVSHDFKTPLTMIKGYASMIMEISGEIPEKRNKHAQVIVDEADRLASLVSDMLDLSKLRSDIEQLIVNEVDMSVFVKETLDRFSYLAETQGYVFETDIEPNLVTRSDKMKIGQVLYNLIGNAVNYTGNDKRIFVRLKRDDNAKEFRFSVSDTGTGITPEEIDTVWDRYYRSSETHKRPVKGTGLGLSIVKTILEKHQFRFGIDSTIGKGSTFYVVFPLVQDGDSQETFAINA